MFVSNQKKMNDFEKETVIATFSLSFFYDFYHCHFWSKSWI